MSQNETERQLILWREAATSRLAAAVKFERERSEQQARAERAEFERDGVAKTAELMTSYARKAEAALARVRALADEWDAASASGGNGRLGFHANEYGDVFARDLRALLDGGPGA